MARKYPRFLFSNPVNTKSKGPFIVHLLSPRFICRITEEDLVRSNPLTTYYIGVSGWVLELLEVFEEKFDEKTVSDCMYDMLTWATKQKEIQDL